MKLIYNNKEVANNTKNYNELLNKPLLNSQELVGNVSLNDINVYNKQQVDNLIASTRSVKAVTSLPSPLVENTMYYVGPDADDNYHVYLVDSALTLIDLGMAREETMYKEGAAIDIATDNSINVKLDYESVSINSEGKIYVPTLKGTKGSDTKPVYLNDGQITASTGTVGSNVRPTYLSNGTVTQVNQVSSGNYTNAVPFIGANGITETGWAFDFHNTDSTSDYEVRMGVNSANGKLEIAYPSTANNGGYLVTSGANASVGSAIQPVYVNNGATVTSTSMFLNDGTTNIPENVDLNTLPYTYPGVYVCQQSVTAETLTNCPVTTPFRMEVVNVTKNDAGTAAVVWSSRVRKLVAWDGREFIQQVATTNNTTPNYGQWRQLIDASVGSHMPEVFYLNQEYSNPTTFRGWTGKERKIRALVSGVQVYDLVSDERRKVKITGGLGYSTSWNLNNLLLNTNSNDTYFTILSGKTGAGTVIQPTTITGTFDSANSVVTINSGLNTDIIFLNYTLEWVRYPGGNSDPYWIGYLTLNGQNGWNTSCCALSAIIQTRVYDSTGATPILYFNGSTGVSNCKFLVEVE